MRAAVPEASGEVVRDGVRLGFEVFGRGGPTILLLPTWTIVHSRFWKLQVPYLARHYRVVTYDGPGNGRSDRCLDPSRYAADSYAHDAAAVLDATETDAAVGVGVSLGGQYGIRLASLYPGRVLGLAIVGAALALADPPAPRDGIEDWFHEPHSAEPVGWEKYNLAYWHAQYGDFVEFFFSEVFNEPHSTKAREDAARWAIGAGPDVLEAEAHKPPFGRGPAEVFEGVECPVLVVHGTEDRVVSHEVGQRAADLAGGAFVSMEGAGHIPGLRDPVRFNLILRDFVEGLRS